MNNTHSAHCSALIRCPKKEHHIYPKQHGPRITTNEKVERERGIEYTSGAAEEEFVRDY